MTRQITITGNLGADPQYKLIPSRVSSKVIYDEIIDDEREIEFTTKEKEVYNLSLAINGEDENGERYTRWVRCTDWHGVTRNLRRGDFVQLTGYFQENVVRKDDQVKTYKNFIVNDVRILRRKRRAAAAA